MSNLTDALGIIGKLLTMSELELRLARAKTDNPKFQSIIDNTLQTRFPKPPK